MPGAVGEGHVGAVGGQPADDLRADAAAAPGDQGDPAGEVLAVVPKSVADRYGPADLVFVPVTDLTATEVVTAWPQVSRSPAVAAFVRVAADAAADLPIQAAALA